MLACAAVLLEAVAEDIREYLRSRRDTIRCIVTMLTDDSGGASAEGEGESLFEELKRNVADEVHVSLFANETLRYQYEGEGDNDGLPSQRACDILGSAAHPISHIPVANCKGLTPCLCWLHIALCLKVHCLFFLLPGSKQ